MIIKVKADDSGALGGYAFAIAALALILSDKYLIDFSGSTTLYYYNQYPFNYYSDLPNYILMANTNTNTGFTLNLFSGTRSVGLKDGHFMNLYNSGSYPISVFFGNAIIDGKSLYGYINVNSGELINVMFSSAWGYYILINFPFLLDVCCSIKYKCRNI